MDHRKFMFLTKVTIVATISHRLHNKTMIVLCQTQGRLYHINDGANAPWKSKGEGFYSLFRNLGGDKMSIVAIISSVN